MLLLSTAGFFDSCAPIEVYEVSLQTPNTSAAWEARVRRRRSNAENDNGGLHSRQDLTSSDMTKGTDPSLGDEPIAWIEASPTVKLLQQRLGPRCPWISYNIINLNSTSQLTKTLTTCRRTTISLTSPSSSPSTSPTSSPPPPPSHLLLYPSTNSRLLHSHITNLLQPMLMVSR